MSEVQRGKTYTKERRERHSAAMALRKGIPTNRGRSVIVNDVRYETIRQASNANGVSPGTIHGWLKKGIARYDS